MSLANLKKSMADLDNLQEEIEKTEKKKFVKQVDERYWTLSKDESGVGYATIRFLPPAAADGENGKLWVQIWDHGFFGPRGKKGPWYIERSLTTIGLKDPVSEYNTELWNSGIESNKDIARSQKRRLRYHSNILVINDPANPENNGTVRLFAYGTKIYEKIKEAMKPPFPDQPRFNPFDFWKGANFNLKVKNAASGFPSYDLSAFSAPSALFDGDETKLEKIFNAEHSLNALLDPSNFKTYDELKAKLNLVLDRAGVAGVDEAKVPSVAEFEPKISLPTERDSSLKKFEDLLKD